MQSTKAMRPEMLALHISSRFEFQVALERARKLEFASPRSVRGLERAALEQAIARFLNGGELVDAR